MLEIKLNILLGLALFHMIERNVRDIVTDNVITNVRSVVRISNYSKTQLNDSYNILETL